MSIETLLEAAKFLEWQALQQQKTREEDELKEKLCLTQQVEQKRAEVTSYAQPVRINHVTWGEKSCPEPRPTAVLPPALPSAVPITVIPIPLVSASPKAPPSLALRPGAMEDAKKRPGGTREVHNKLEKNRRAHLKECFETLKKNIPTVEEKKTSNLSVLRSALRYIQGRVRGGVVWSTCHMIPPHPPHVVRPFGRTMRFACHVRLIGWPLTSPSQGGLRV
ncbi:hypothetical protein MATL_G00115510 [Megalops atlanticus]|uniref:Max-binding protein MNT n=1 Tax=Megalops atlanticus TaxID=7932 RepID=A0A9D3PXN2_MEGAT|nr:hypothetical protein MATL_G00115510 [Megalops atlanticus]